MSNIKITELAAPGAPDNQNHFDLTKPVQTRDGRKALVLATGLRGPFSIVFKAENENGTDSVYRCNSAGELRYDDCSPCDLVNVRQQKVVDYWLVLSPDGDVWAYDSEHYVLSARGPADVAVHIQRTFDL